MERKDTRKYNRAVAAMISEGIEFDMWPFYSHPKHFFDNLAVNQHVVENSNETTEDRGEYLCSSYGIDLELQWQRE